MCGRFTLRCPAKLLADAFGLGQEARLVKGLARKAAELGYRLEPTTATGT